MIYFQITKYYKSLSNY